MEVRRSERHDRGGHRSHAGHLTALKAGAELASTSLRDTLVVHVLRGRVRLTADEMHVDLRSGQLGTLEDPSAWRVRADSDALLLLTAGQPAEVSAEPSAGA